MRRSKTFVRRDGTSSNSRSRVDPNAPEHEARRGGGFWPTCVVCGKGVILTSEPPHNPPTYRHG